MIVLPARTHDLVAPLGLVFTDGPGGPPVLDGLSVVAWPEARPDRRTPADVNGAGIAAFRRLPGLALDPAAPFAGPTRAFVVEVSDTRGRFLTGRVHLPAPARGPQSVALFSTPARRGAGRIEFRAEVWDVGNNRPAAFALVVVKLAGNGAAVVATGLTDASGRLLALGDWPTPKTPLAGAGGPPARWAAPRPLVLEVNYDGAVPPAVPRLDRLNALPAARAWDRRNPDEPYSPPDLVADKPPVFRSAADAEGRLLVTTS